MKIHTVLDYDSELPSFAEVSDGRKHDLKAAKGLQLPTGSVLVVDRAYVDFAWLKDLDSRGILFVTRLKDRSLTEIVESYGIQDQLDGLVADQDIVLTGSKTSRTYSKPLRFVTRIDPEMTTRWFS
ncbi:MAG: transposase [Saprospiraceae bacterium]|nr:transposase [Saprospiraceae bacterium]